MPGGRARSHDTKGEVDTIKRKRTRADEIGRLGLMPPWFSGVLPEGALRELVEDELGPGRHNENVVLARLDRGAKAMRR
ncbi:hypothetical protein [Methylobacterium sp. GXS13]|uniref:hypothetical protein n=1 Tax=Methylobacterium sp. GXS13 TaxID=1730094 RepID=UPI00128F4D9B|nr:hypothetical protein [Methylobacterium sp. GXS13]